MVKLTHEAVVQGLPTEKIRQKLVLEGAEPDVIDLVLDGQGAQPPISGPIEPSSPCTSPQRRQLSARWVYRADSCAYGISSFGGDLRRPFAAVVSVNPEKWRQVEAVIQN